MALTSSQEALRLFKQSLGVADTNPAGEFFVEPIKEVGVILPNQIWTQGDQITSTAPTGLTNSGVSGVVQYFVDLPLTAVAGTSVAFYSSSLVNAIPFNWDSAGSYNYTLKDSTGAVIPFGQNNWVVDIGAGVLTFYGTGGVPSTPANMPPKITFYKYIGTIGLGVTNSNLSSYVTTGTTQNITGLKVFLSGISSPGLNLTTFNEYFGYNAGNSNATPTFNVAVGSLALSSVTNVFNNVAIGTKALVSNRTGNDNIGIGANSLAFLTTSTNNVAIGSWALRFYVGGGYNTAIGAYTMYNSLIGTGNTAIGYEALGLNSGSSNVAIGYQTLFNNLGNENVGIGYISLSTNRGGSGNVGIGYKTLHELFSGSFNIAIGHSSLQQNISGTSNTSVGFIAGYHNFGSYNVFLGYGAGYFETGSNKLYINNTTTDQWNTLIYGEFDNRIFRITGQLQLSGGVSSLYSNNNNLYLSDTTGTYTLNNLVNSLNFLSANTILTSSLSALTDVSLSALTDGQVLTYSGGTNKWVNENINYLPSSAYTDQQISNLFSGVTNIWTIYINQTNDPNIPGDDINGSGTSSAPYATILRALQSLPPLVFGSVTFQFSAGTWTIGNTECIELSKKRFYYSINSANISTFTLQGAAFAQIGTLSLTQGSIPYNYNIITTGITVDQYEGNYMKNGSSFFPIEGNTSTGITVASPNTPAMTAVYATTTTITFIEPIVEFLPIAMNNEFSFTLKNLYISHDIAHFTFLPSSTSSVSCSYSMTNCTVHHYTAGNSPMLTINNSQMNLTGCFFYSQVSTSFALQELNSNIVMSSCVFRNDSIGGYGIFSNIGGACSLQNIIFSYFSVGMAIFWNNQVSSLGIYFKVCANVIQVSNVQPTGSMISLSALYVDNGSYILNFQNRQSNGLNIYLPLITASSGSYTMFNPASKVINKFVSPNLGINMTIQGTYPEIQTDINTILSANTINNVPVGDTTYNRSIIIKYTMVRGTIYQQGMISILNTGILLYINDEFQSTDNIGVTFDVGYNIVNTNQIDLVCTATNLDANPITFNYNVERVMF